MSNIQYEYHLSTKEKKEEKKPRVFKKKEK